MAAGPCTTGGSMRRTRNKNAGRGAGNLGARAQIGQAPALILTGGTSGPSWPKSAPIERRQALPRAATKRQVKADQRLASKGGADWLTGGRGRERRAAA